jgi:hypothetical protein
MSAGCRGNLSGKRKEKVDGLYVASSVPVASSGSAAFNPMQSEFLAKKNCRIAAATSHAMRVSLP